jgi:SAM-dependent methyltransferase
MQHSDSYQEIFSERGDRYHMAMQRWPDARRAELELLPRRLGVVPGETVIDAPAGGGYLLGHLPPDVRYIAVDPVAEFHDRCPGRAGVDRIHSSLERVELADGVADAVVSLAGLHHEPHLAAVLGEFGRLLYPGGRLGIAEVAVGSAPARFLNEFVDAHSSQGHDGSFFDESVVGLLEAAGLVEVELESVPLQWQFPGIAAMTTFTRNLFGMDLADDDQVEAGIERILGTSPASHGGVAMHWELLVITARKSA